MSKMFLCFATVLLVFSCVKKETAQESFLEPVEVISNKGTDGLMNEVVIGNKPYKWNYDSPLNHNLSEAFLSDFYQKISKMKITSSIIVRDGKIVSEYYAKGHNTTTLYSVHSCSKSITSALFGIALEQALIPSVNVSIAEYFSPLPNENFKSITLEHLLTNMSGIESTENNWQKWRSSPNWTEAILSYPLRHKPNSVFSYSTGNTHLLSAVIEKATGESLYDYAKREIFDKIGMTSVTCGLSPEGVADGGNGFRMTSRDMALFGLLYLKGGTLLDKAIVPESWVKTSTKAHMTRKVGANYGYQWWVRDFLGYEGFFAYGYGEQYIIVVPQLSMVVTFTSTYPDITPYETFMKLVESIVAEVRS